MDSIKGAFVEAVIRSRFADDGLLAPLVQSYLVALPEIIGAITGAYEAADFDHLRRLSHRLCGEAAVYGFDALGKSAHDLEEAAAKQIPRALAPAYEALIHNYLQIVP